MDENQTNQNLNQQPVQPQPEQVQQPVQLQPEQVKGQQSAEQPSISMQIQQLLVQQQQYQKQYNELVDYVKKTPNLPLDQVNQIKSQLDQLNALFVQGKQKLQALGYTQVQVNKPTEVKKGPRSNFSLKKLAIGCGIILLLILVGFGVTLVSLINNPGALMGIGVSASLAKALLQGFSALLFGSIIILMIGVVIANIYRLITVKNQSRKKYIWGLIGGLLGIVASGVIMGLIFSWIGKIVTEVKTINYDLVQPYLVGRVKDERIDKFAHPYDDDDDADPNDGENYPLIAPSEMAFSLRRNELERLMNKVDVNYELVSITLSCGNKDNTVLNLPDLDSLQSEFEGTCLYSEKGKYTYYVDVTYYNSNYHEIKTEKFQGKSLNYESAVSLSKTTSNSSSSNSVTTKLSSSNGEFILGKAPAKISADSTQVFRDFSLQSYNNSVEWDMDGDFENDRIDQVNFDYSYNKPKVYYVTYKFPGLSDKTRYRFPVRVEPSDVPVCVITTENFSGTTKYHITTDFMDPTDATKIDSYKYTIRNRKTKGTHEIIKDASQEINYTFPEQGTYVVVLDYVTVDGKQGRCESEPIQMEKERFNVQYAILELNPESGKFKELCSNGAKTKTGCSEIFLDTVPQTYQLQIKSITPYSNTLKKVVSLNDTSLLNENDTYTFDIRNEGKYEVKIVTSDVGRGMDDEEININFTAKKPDIVGLITITSSESDETKRKPVTEGFEPLTVILDASKTEVNVEGDEIIYFTWNFGDGEIKRNIQNGVVAHTYNYDYSRENGIFQPTVAIKTRNGIEKTIYGPKLNVKKGLISVEIEPVSHPSRQAPVGTEVEFAAEFDGLPEKMIWDFGDGTTPVTCVGRNCTEIKHTFDETGLFSIKVSLEFDAVQQVDGTMDFKVF